MNIKVSRSRPYLPSFRRMAASTMDPATGASTCALGSQRCTVNRGIFAMNAATDMAHQRGRKEEDGVVCMMEEREM